MGEAFVATGLSPADPVDATIDIAVSPSKVWAAISATGGLTSIHPFCASNEVERWPGRDGRDHVRYYSGLHYVRDVIEWHEGVGYDLAVGPPAGKIAIARWRIEPIDGTSRARFGIEVTSYVRDDVVGQARARYIDEVIVGAIPPYLDAVVRGVAHFCETDTPVEPNQFGPHPIYSPAAARN